MRNHRSSLLASFCALSLGACSAAAHAAPDHTGDADAGLQAEPVAITHALVNAPLRAGARESDVYHRFRIPLARTRIAFVDLRYETPLIEALGEHTLVINGGYWAYGGRGRIIQGLLAVDGKQLAPLVRKAGGGVLSVRGGRAQLTAAESWHEQPDAELLLQCKPRLVGEGKLIPQLDKRRHAPRTALCIRDDGAVLDAYLTDPDVRPTLAELGAFLLAEGCSDALNLDGGPSTAAVFRVPGEEPMAIGRGLELPYGLGFSPR
jgi:hypothetical protein